jgi:hypothetical protein
MIGMIRTNLSVASILVLSFLNLSCSGLLPSVKETTESRWQSFEEAKQAFDKVIPHETTRSDLKQLGFDPFETPNVKLVTYLELTEKFMPNQSITINDLDPGVQACLRAREVCQGYEVSPQVLTSKRYGNVFLDLFNFRRQKVTTGWKFDALIVLKDGLVVHKIWGGEPKVSEFEDKKNPLGPLQDIEKVLPPLKIN